MDDKEKIERICLATGEGRRLGIWQQLEKRWWVIRSIELIPCFDKEPTAGILYCTSQWRNFLCSADLPHPLEWKLSIRWQMREHLDWIMNCIHHLNPECKFHAILWRDRMKESDRRKYLPDCNLCSVLSQTASQEHKASLAKRNVTPLKHLGRRERERDESTF